MLLGGRRWDARLEATTKHDRQAPNCMPIRQPLCCSEQRANEVDSITDAAIVIQRQSPVARKSATERSCKPELFQNHPGPLNQRKAPQLANDLCKCSQMQVQGTLSWLTRIEKLFPAGSRADPPLGGSLEVGLLVSGRLVVSEVLVQVHVPKGRTCSTSST